MQQTPFTVISPANKILIRRQLDAYSLHLQKLAKLQLCSSEDNALELIGETTSYFLTTTKRGYILNDAVFNAHMQMLEVLYDQTLPQYEQHVLSIYMHPNGALRNEWRKKAVNGVIPLSSRVDWIAEAHRRIISSSTPASDYVAISSLTS